MLAPNFISRIHVGWLRLSLHVACCWWLASAYFSALNDTIGGDPVQSLIHFYGLAALRLLLLSLFMTPLVRYARQPALMRLRRPLGLWAAAFASAHLSVYVVYDLQMNWAEVFSEIIKRPYITVGMLAWLILLVLAITSVPRLVRALGKRWKQLHNVVYLSAALVCLHFLWSVKADIVEPGLYIVILGMLLWLRKDKFFRYFRRSKGHNR